MQPVMGVADVVEFEAALAERGVSTQELMRRAGAVVALQAAGLVESGSIVVLCGMGNNGGDGWVAADNLARHGYEVNVVSAATPAIIKGEAARRAAQRAAEMGVPVHVDPSRGELDALLGNADVVVDAVFGTGFKGTMPAPYDMWVRAVEESFAGSVVSVDVPSGINATTGMSEGPHFAADVTVTMFAMKPGLISGEGRAAAGEVAVASLATDDEGIADLSDAAAAFTLSDADYLGVLPEADPLQDKYTHGRVLVVAGSARYPGAAVMAAVAAARAGAGYVTLAVPAPVVPVAQAHLLSVPVVGLPADEEGSLAGEAADRVAALAARADVVLAGPGLTTSFGACETVRRLLAEPCALVLDADALNALVKICTGSAEEHPDALRREFPLVLTPHRRELARLVGAEPAACSSLAGAMRAAQALAWAVGSADFAVVAKGPVSAVATIDSTVVPEPGPASLATAGTGDVLAGAAAAVLAQALACRGPEEGVGSSELLLLMAAVDRAHALAGYLAEQDMGTRGVVAPDVAQRMGLALDLLAEQAERAAEEAGEDAGGRLEGDLAFEDESRITPPPEVARLIAADASAREARLPGELKAYEGELEEPQEAAPSVSKCKGAAGAEAEPEAEGEPEADAVPEAEEDCEADEASGACRESEGDETVTAGEGPAAPRVSEAAPDPTIGRGASVPPFLSAVAGSAAPKAAAGFGSALPPFLSRASAAPVPADATTVMPAVAVSDGGADEPAAPDGEGSEPVEERPEQPRELTPEEYERLRAAAYHERATLHIDDESVTPVDKRPSAKARRRH